MAYTTGTIASISDLVTFGPQPGVMVFSLSGTWSGTIALIHYITPDVSYTIDTYTSNPDPPVEINCRDGVGVYCAIPSSWTSGTATVTMSNV